MVLATLLKPVWVVGSPVSNTNSAFEFQSLIEGGLYTSIGHVDLYSALLKHTHSL